MLFRSKNIYSAKNKVKFILNGTLLHITDLFISDIHHTSIKCLRKDHFKEYMGNLPLITLTVCFILATAGFVLWFKRLRHLIDIAVQLKTKNTNFKGNP